MPEAEYASMATGSWLARVKDDFPKNSVSDNLCRQCLKSARCTWSVSGATIPVFLLIFIVDQVNLGLKS